MDIINYTTSTKLELLRLVLEEPIERKMIMDTTIILTENDKKNLIKFLDRIKFNGIKEIEAINSILSKIFKQEQEILPTKSEE